ncbi:hypothetical protein [Streptomyces diacarni]|uniref:hypothetical protein n=1 Tax=Streptomyces diacarni TaxID=2800381 RepID=UPI0015F0D9E8|nr:hypothetical protein [Streptomyces diacarni]
MARSTRVVAGAGTVGEADSGRPAASAMAYHAESGSSDMAAPARLGATGELHTDR